MFKSVVCIIYRNILSVLDLYQKNAQSELEYAFY